MRRLIIASLALAVCLLAGGGAAPADGWSGGAGKAPPPLRLSAEILKQWHCEQPTDGVVLIYLILRLRFTNVSEKEVLIRKGSEVASFDISKTAEDARRGRHEASFTPEPITPREPEPPTESGPAPGEVLSLAPGGVYETVGRVEFLVSPAIPELVAPGAHVLRVNAPLRVHAGAGKPTPSRRLRVISDPMPFEVKAGAAEESCDCRDSGIDEGRAIAVAEKSAGGAYDTSASTQRCEWIIRLRRRQGGENPVGFEYGINKKSGEIIYKVEL